MFTYVYLLFGVLSVDTICPYLPFIPLITRNFCPPTLIGEPSDLGVSKLGHAHIGAEEFHAKLTQFGATNLKGGTPAIIFRNCAHHFGSVVVASYGRLSNAPNLTTSLQRTGLGGQCWVFRFDSWLSTVINQQ